MQDRTFTRRDMALLATTAAAVAAAAATPAAAAEQPRMTEALKHLNDALDELRRGSPDKGGFRDRAITDLEKAIRDVEDGIRYFDTH